MGDQAEPVEQIDKQGFEPTSTVEQRRFSAPQMEWDASRYVQSILCLQFLTPRQCSTSNGFETRSSELSLTNLRIQPGHLVVSGT